MMEKKTIVIQRIKDHVLMEKPDEVALEQRFSISLRDGRQISVTCTPTHMEEMILARRYLAGDLSVDNGSKDKEFRNMVIQSEESLLSVTTEEIFQVARDSFENPGSLFNDTGCAHSCALVHKGDVVCCIEDIGRHNALDKIIGYALMNKIPFSQSYVFTSGRISTDYLKKAIDAGFPMVVSRAAVTASAVELAKEKNVTLLGFIRKNTGNLYWEGAVKIESSKESDKLPQNEQTCENAGTYDNRELKKWNAWKFAFELKKERKNKYSLLLLAGGKSFRMGQNKAELLYEGKTFTENLISKAKTLGIDQIYVSGFQGDRDDVQVVWDVYPERGPLGGIHACMKQVKTPFCLVLPVDVPQIPVDVLERLMEFHEKCTLEPADKQLPVLLEHGNRMENLIGIYPVEMIDFIENLIRERSASVHGMLWAWGFQCCRMDLPEWQVENINTQEAYQGLLSISEDKKKC